MYQCPVCSERFELVIEKRASLKLDEKQVTLTVVHDHSGVGGSDADESSSAGDSESTRTMVTALPTPVWRASVVEKGERRSEEAKDIQAKNLAMKKVARENEVKARRKVPRGATGGISEEERAKKVAAYEEFKKKLEVK